MADGIYSIVYRGAVGWGQGMMMLRRGVVTGVDTVGVLYDGRYEENAAALVLTAKMVVPPGVVLVQGTPPRPNSYELAFNAVIPRQAIETSQPVLVELPPGPVNAIFKLLRPLVD